jgi:hypothetical protein
MKEKQANSISTQVYLQTVAEVVVTVVIVLRNYRNKANKQTNTGFQRTVKTSYCRQLQGLATIGMCQHLTKYIIFVFTPFFLNVLSFATDFHN